MDHLQSEFELAWEELSFWQDFMVWLQASSRNSDELRVLEALENAERRYAKALQSRQRPMVL